MYLSNPQYNLNGLYEYGVNNAKVLYWDGFSATLVSNLKFQFAFFVVPVLFRLIKADKRRFVRILPLKRLP